MPAACRAPPPIALDSVLEYSIAMQNTTKSPRHFSTLPTADKLKEFHAWLEEHKAADVTTIDLAGAGAFAEGLIVATASSVRHAQSLADGVAALCRDRNFEYLRTEGHTAGQWILVDCNDVIINIFQAATRDLYQVDDLWKSAAALRAAREEG